MSPESDPPPTHSDLQKEILAQREFSIAELISREGSSLMKGESPIPRLDQAKTEITNFIDHHLSDRSGALLIVLQRWVEADDATVSQQIDAPLRALVMILEGLIANPELLYEFVKQVDIEWGRIYQERPHFQRPGQAPDPDDEYTHESVRQQLSDLLDTVNQAQA